MEKPVLILAPHTDDGEFGCGGTIARFLEEGRTVYYAAFSTCGASVPEGYPRDRLKTELLAAMDSFQIPREHVVIMDYPVREFPAHRQEILDDMIRLGRRLDPGMVLAPSIHDVHQDHHTVAEEARRAFKHTTLLGYEVPWNNFTFENQVYVALEQRHVDRKLAAIACYESQRERAYADPAFIAGQARVHGVQAGCGYAEVFEAVRWIL